MENYVNQNIIFYLNKIVQTCNTIIIDIEFNLCMAMLIVLLFKTLEPGSLVTRDSICYNTIQQS